MLPATPSVAAPGAELVKKSSKKRRSSTRPTARGDLDTEALADADKPESPPLVQPLVQWSAADRRMSWRGGDVALPPARHDFAASETVRSLSDDEIASAVREQSELVTDCLLTAAAGSQAIATVTLKMLVDGAGRVAKHRVHAPQYLFEHGLSGCLDRAASKLRFAAVGGFTVVTAPFELR